MKKANIVAFAYALAVAIFVAAFLQSNWQSIKGLYEKKNGIPQRANPVSVSQKEIVVIAGNTRASTSYKILGPTARVHPP